MREQSLFVNFKNKNTSRAGDNKGRVLMEAVRKLQERFDETPLLLHGNFAPWMINPPLTLADIVICATAAGVHLAFISQTGTAKSMAANVILKALCRDMEKLDCVGDLDSGILKDIRPHENGIIINDSRLTKVEGVQMEELNRTIPFGQPVLKLIIGNSYPNHKMIIGTMNPPGSRYHVENLDVSIASGFVQVNFEHSMSNENRIRLKNQKILGFNNINSICLRGNDGQPLIEGLLAIRGTLEDIVPIVEDAEILLDCINMNKCWCSYSTQKRHLRCFLLT